MGSGCLSGGKLEIMQGCRDFHRHAKNRGTGYIVRIIIREGKLNARMVHSIMCSIRSNNIKNI